MTKQDYIVIADIIKEIVNLINLHRKDDNFPEWIKRYLINRFVELFEDENDKFDKVKFIDYLYKE